MLINLHHVSIIVQNVEKSLAFYQGILELDIDESRPDLGYPGAWLNIGTSEDTINSQIHLLQLPNPDPLQDRPQHGGRDRHVAVQVNSLEQLIAALDANNITYTLSRSGRKALFCRDPDSNALEFIEVAG